MDANCQVARYSFYCRCKTIWIVTQIRCPKCEEKLNREAEYLICPRCNWVTTWGRYHKSYKKKRIHGGRARQFFYDFASDWPRAKSAQEKMILIDSLVHAVHEDVSGGSMTPASANLVAAKRADILELLNDLASDSSLAGSNKEARDEYLRKQMVGTKADEQHKKNIQARWQKESQTHKA